MQTSRRFKIKKLPPWSPDWATYHDVFYEYCGPTRRIDREDARGGLETIPVTATGNWGKFFTVPVKDLVPTNDHDLGELDPSKACSLDNPECESCQ